ncbi:RNA 2',3'-cyclic phosphodiesterase [Robertmurraya massiliosenegalensis]|uniref:RNA 2',3'-cyclic phosphodiesterase n=1 Tax=Robertmurraya TaxID=2837507 RepID=UPI0039A4CDE9
MERKPHFFYALKLPKEVKTYLEHTCEKLKQEFPFSSWVHREDYHITLAFLGSANLEQLEVSLNAVEKELSEGSSFSLKINHLGVFGRSDSPRIFWAGLEKEERLFLLRNQVYQACKRAGFQLDTREFNPHLTLARKWKGDQSFSIESLTRIEPISFMANEVVLYETHVQKLPKYEVKKSFSLK